MSRKNKNKNQYGSFATGKVGYKKYARFFITALVVVIFVSGIGLIIFNKVKQPVKQAQVADTTDAGKIPGWWYQQYFGASVCDKDICKEDADPDKDKLTNLQEFYYHTNPLDGFTVKDKLNDGQLVAAGFDPSRSGRLTFDQVISDDNILGESLVFDQDIKQMVAESQDISKINLPLVSDDEIEIIYNNSQTTYQTYSSAVQSAIDKYFPAKDTLGITEILKSGSDAEVESIKRKAGLLSAELKIIPVPATMLMFHKYNLLVYRLLPEILLSSSEQGNLSSTQSDAWYDKVQAFLAATQRLNLEKQRLILQSQSQP
jgi:hypothetical protein